jgi:hypothetical protein
MFSSREANRYFDKVLPEDRLFEVLRFTFFRDFVDFEKVKPGLSLCLLRKL